MAIWVGVVLHARCLGASLCVGFVGPKKREKRRSGSRKWVFTKRSVMTYFPWGLKIRILRTNKNRGYHGLLLGLLTLEYKLSGTTIKRITAFPTCFGGHFISLLCTFSYFSCFQSERHDGGGSGTCMAARSPSLSLVERVVTTNIGYELQWKDRGGDSYG